MKPFYGLNKNQDSRFASNENVPEKLSGIEPISESRGIFILNKRMLKGLVETPLLEACEILYDKNIQTTETTANRENIQYGVTPTIVINYDTLSFQNKEIAKKLCKIVKHSDGQTVAMIEVEADESSTVSEIKEKFNKIVEQFITQPLVWSPPRTIEEMRILSGKDPNDPTYNPQSFLISGSEIFYDKENKLFYASKEHFEKTKAYNESTKAE